MRSGLHTSLLFTALVAMPVLAKNTPPPLTGTFTTATTLKRFPAPDAFQAVAVDKKYFYAINNNKISKHDKKNGQEIAHWEANADYPLIHFDSATIVDGKLYLAHSNYPLRPMTSSIEVFDTKSLNHISSHSFGIERGSLTWIDRDAAGRWWGGFGNYDRIQKGDTTPYGGTRNSQIVRFGKNWRIEESFILPDDLLARFGEMSNSGGAFGPDGKLYITGHDNGEAYMIEPPKAGSVMRWTKTIKLDIEGQGIAWDKSTKSPLIYGIKRDKENGNTVGVFEVMP